MYELDLLRKPFKRPKHPGKLLKRFLKKEMITQQQLAGAMEVSRLTVNELVKGKRRVTPVMALKLGQVLGTPAEIWLHMQMRVDLFDARVKLGSSINFFKKLR